MRDQKIIFLNENDCTEHLVFSIEAKVRSIDLVITNTFAYCPQEVDFVQLELNTHSVCYVLLFGRQNT